MWCVCLHVGARGMPLGTRLRSAWLALFASPACAAVMQPHPPCEKCRLAASAHPRQSEDCLRVRVHRHAPLLARRGRRAAAAFPAQHIRSVLSIMRRCVGAFGYRARIRRKARNPSAPAQRGAWSEYLPSRRASAIAASCASRRLRLLRLVSPPPRLASRKVGTRAPRWSEALAWRRSRGASGNACADILRIARAGWAALTTGPERILRRDAQDAARRRCRAQGGIPTKPCKAHSRMDCASRGKAESAVAEWRAVPEPPTRPCQPRAASPPTAERPLRRAVAERGGRTRRQSSDCRAVRTDAPARSAQGEARLGRSGAHAVEAGQRHSIRRRGARHTAPHAQHPHENG